jgi:hypothetical protein
MKNAIKSANLIPIMRLEIVFVKNKIILGPCQVIVVLKAFSATNGKNLCLNDS